MNHLVRVAGCLIAALLMATGSNAGIYQTISIDGDMSDWSGVPLSAADPSDSLSSVDFANLYLANDDAFLYVRFTLHSAADPFTFLSNYFFDADANAATGFGTFGVGSEMLIQSGSGFQQKNGGFNEGPINGLGFASAADGGMTDFEFRVSRDATYSSDGAPVFASDAIEILLETDTTGFAVADTLTDGVSYQFAAIPEPSAVLFGLLLTVGRLTSGSRTRGSDEDE